MQLQKVWSVSNQVEGNQYHLLPVFLVVDIIPSLKIFHFWLVEQYQWRILTHRPYLIQLELILLKVLIIPQHLILEFKITFLYSFYFYFITMS